MKKYIVVDEQYNDGKMFSFSTFFYDSDNLLAVVKRYPRAVAISIMPTKKHAEEVAAANNAFYSAENKQAIPF